VALSLLVSALFPQHQAHKEKVRHDTAHKSKLEPANVFLMGVAPWSRWKAILAEEARPILEKSAEERQVAAGEHGKEGGRGNKKTLPPTSEEGFRDRSGEVDRQFAQMAGVASRYRASSALSIDQEPSSRDGLPTVSRS
jgi:hypothetical protein